MTSNIEIILYTILSMSGRAMTLSEIIGAWREMYFERPDRKKLQRDLLHHPGVRAEGLTFRIDPVRGPNWLVDHLGLSARAS